jgi:hypothetical protein
MKLNQFYCVKCRKAVTVKQNDICFKYLKNKKIGKVPSLKGECGKCDTNLTKFVKNVDATKLKKKYGTC